MARRINLLLVRHAISEANLDKTVNARLPDTRVPLAPEGHEQAAAAGEAIAEWLSDRQDRRGFDARGGTRILCSPYQRTRETSLQIEEQLDAAGIKFDRREELALREISFGLFDGIADEELSTRFPAEHAHYQKHVDFEGEFYAPMPMGESRAQVADRVKGVFGTIIRDNDPERGNAIRNFIIVSHGVTIRAFMMQWLHRTPEWYQDQKNPNNASVTLITNRELDPRGGFPDPYLCETIFEGFPHVRRKQDVREEGHL